MKRNITITKDGFRISSPWSDEFRDEVLPVIRQLKANFGGRWLSYEKAHLVNLGAFTELQEKLGQWFEFTPELVEGLKRLSAKAEEFVDITVTLRGEEAIVKPNRYLGGADFQSFRDALKRAGFRTRRVNGEWENYASWTKLPALYAALERDEFSFQRVDTSALEAKEQAKADAKAKAEARRQAAVEERIARGRKVLADWGSDFYPYQTDGVRWLSERHRALLADDMGLGKTIQALIAAPSDAPILVICPASLKLNWQNEAARWRPEFSSYVVNGRTLKVSATQRKALEAIRDGVKPRGNGKTLAALEKKQLITLEDAKPALSFDGERVLAGAGPVASFRMPRPGEVVIANYELLPECVEGMHAGTVLIADEAHAFKSYKAKRTQLFRSLARQVREAKGWTWGLTGTPMLNRPPELWGVLTAFNLQKAVFESWNDFLEAFHAYKGRYGMVWGRPIPLVKQWLEPHMLRRTKAEVLPQLPEKRRAFRTVEISAKAAKAATETLEALKAQGIDLVELAEKAGEQADSSEVSIPFTGVSAAMKALAAAKIPALLDVVEEYEATDTPLVVFSAHLAPVQALAGRDGWATITGGMSSEARQKVVDDFQAGHLKGVAATIQAAGVGITLTRSSDVVFVDRAWTPALNIQAEDRCHRIGQASSVSITYLVASHQLDWALSAVLSYKQRLIVATIGE